MGIYGIDHFGLPANIGVFVGATVFIWIAGTRLVFYGDELAERFHLGQAFVGLLILAAITSLPEVVTTLTAAGAGNAALTLGNLFGGVSMQTAILAVADILFVRHALTSWPRKPTHALEAVLLIVLLAAVLAVSMIGDVAPLWQVGIASLALCLGYPGAILILRQYDERATWAPIDIPEDAPEDALVTRRAGLSQLSGSALIGHIVAAGLVILFAGYVTADRAGAIAEQSGLGGTFVGVALLAAATSTPEVSTTFAAARIGAYTLAISNIFGSNMIMVALVLPADLAYRAGPILNETTPAIQVTLAVGILVTALYVAGILLRRTPRLFGAGADSVAVLMIYVASLFVVYRLAHVP